MFYTRNMELHPVAVDRGLRNKRRVRGQRHALDAGRFCETEVEKVALPDGRRAIDNDRQRVAGDGGRGLPDGAEAQVALFVTVLGDKGGVTDRLIERGDDRLPFGR